MTTTSTGVERKKPGPKASGIRKVGVYMRVPFGREEEIRARMREFIAGEVLVSCAAKQPESGLTIGESGEIARLQAHLKLSVASEERLLARVGVVQANLEACQNQVYDEAMARWKERALKAEARAKELEAMAY
jgi:hypothetical protein